MSQVVSAYLRRIRTWLDYFIFKCDLPMRSGRFMTVENLPYTTQ